ncbi:MAG TPA: serine/threonine protein kinase [Methanoculleus sp.]|nr:serine/threonine protein kinase [Methanoculleus sp.]
MVRRSGSSSCSSWVYRGLCIALILLLLAAAPAAAEKPDDPKPERTWPGQGVGPEKTPGTEPAPEVTPEATPDITPETTPASTPAETTPAAAGDEPDEQAETADTGAGPEESPGGATGGDDGMRPLLLFLVPAAAVLAAGIIIATRRREPSGDAGAPERDAGFPGAVPAPASVRTVVVQGAQDAVPGPAAEPGFPPSLAAKYRDIGYLGQGGIARVYRAERIADGVTVAVKIPLVPDEETGTHFMREIRFWERLHHPNILAIYAANILPVPYVEMEYVDGSLKDCALPLSPEAAVRVIRGVAQGLSYAHGEGVIHRDIKPENILLAAGGVPKITDWGLGSVTDGGHRTRVGGFSPGYAAPEQLRSSVYGAEDARTDLYQLGVLFYELLTGTLPYPGTGIGDIALAVIGEPAPLPSAAGAPTAAFDAVIGRCLEKEKEKRFSSVAEFCSALDEAGAGDASPPAGSRPADG